MNIFPRNTLTSYTTHLPDVMDLDGDYEVGLSEIHYPHAWNTYRTENTWSISIIYVIQNMQTGADGSIDDDINNYIITLENKEYVDIRHLIDTCNTKIRDKLYGKTFNFPLITWDDKALCVIINNTLEEQDNIQKFCFITCSPELSKVFGLHEYKLDVRQLPIRVIGSQNVSFRNFFDQIYVYSDVCEERYVGDVKASLLRVVPIKGRSGDVVSIIYDKPHYIPVVKNRIQAIQILLRTDTGQPIKFINGRVVVTLHFRKRRPEF